MICRNCGIEFQPKSRGRRNPRFCCKKCADTWRARNKTKKYHRVCEYCGATFETNSRKQRYCSYACAGKARRVGRTVYIKTCPYCKKEFETIDKKQIYCSSACTSRYFGQQRKGEYFCEYCGKPRYSDHPNRNRFCSRECAIKYRQLQNLPKKLEQERRKAEVHKVKICPECGKEFQAKSSTQKYCCRDCTYKANLREHREQYLENYKPLYFVCAECGKRVITTLGDTHRVYCSEDCMKHATHKQGKRQRREQIKKSYVEPVNLWSVYANSKGICDICGLPVPHTTDCKNQWAATIDHIVPLSLGGAHSYKNCQLAHRICNSLKGQTALSFHVDWNKLLSEEPGRWNEKLDNLLEQLAISGY